MKEHQLCDEPAKPSTLPPRPSIHHILGDDPCLWGPSVTCRDADIAARCGSTAYCQQKVWFGSSPLANKKPQRVVPGLELIDCSRPLAELCVSPSLRYCGQSVLDQCKKYGDEEADLRRQMCKDRPVSFCADAKMVEICGMGEYCEAMGMAPTPAPPTTTTKKPQDPRCRRGLAFACQTYANAVMCDKVEICKQRVFGF